MPSVAAARFTSGTGFDNRYLERAVTLSRVVLNQVHDRCCYEADSGSTSSHRLLYMLSGSGSASIDGCHTPLQQRHFIWIYPGQSFHIKSTGNANEAMRFICVDVQPGKGCSLLDIAFQAADDIRSYRDLSGMDELLFQLMKELQLLDKYALTILDNLLNQLMAQLCRLLEGNTLQQIANGRAVNKKELVYQTIQYFDIHIENIDELGQVAEALGYSYSYLSHAFRSEMGITLQGYWANRRMLRAMNRLQAGRSSITKISEELQYQSIHSFSKAFKKVTGFTPSEYQSLYGK